MKTKITYIDSDLYRELSKFKYHHKYEFYYNMVDTVVATRPGRDEGSGTDYRYTKIVEIWNRIDGGWYMKSSVELYQFPRRDADIYVKAHTEGFVSSFDILSK